MNTKIIIHDQRTSTGKSSATKSFLTGVGAMIEIDLGLVSGNSSPPPLFYLVSIDIKIVPLSWRLPAFLGGIALRCPA